MNPAPEYELEDNGCDECKDHPSQWVIAHMRSGCYLLRQCEEHRLNPHPVFFELSPLEAAFLPCTIGMA